MPILTAYSPQSGVSGQVNLGLGALFGLCTLLPAEPPGQGVEGSSVLNANVGAVESGIRRVNRNVLHAGPPQVTVQFVGE